MRKDYDLVGSYDNQRISSISAERTVNLFEYLDEDGKRPKVLLPTSGLINADLNFGEETGGSRGSFVFNDSIFQVYGASVYLISAISGTLITTFIGTINNTQPYVGIDANTFQVIFVDGLQGWIYDINARTFKLITDPSFPASPIDVCYLDGFFLVANGGTNNFQLSEFNEGLVWGPDYTSGTGNAFLATSGSSPNLVLSTGTTAYYQVGTPIQFNGGGTLPTGTPTISNGVTYYIAGVINSTTFTISLTIGGAPITFSSTGSGSIFVTNNGQLQQGSITSHPGNIVACDTLHRRIFLFSDNFTEVWENAGLGSNLPFRRNNSSLMEVGTPAIGSISVGFDRMFFLAQDKDGLAGVVEVRGTESAPVSNRALDYQLSQYAATFGVNDARGVLVKENGIIFYRINFTAANHTFVLNVSMSTQDRPRWHEEEVLNGDRHPAQTHAYFDGINYYGSYNSPNFYIVDSQTYTNELVVDNLQQIRRMRIGKQMTPEGYNRLRIDRFQIDLLQGQLQNDLFQDVDLLAESGDPLLTEASINIILEQELSGGSIGFTATHGLDAILTTPYAPNAMPTVFLSISKDGGQTYGNYLHATMGKVGERTHRTVWRKLGTTPRGQGFVPRVEFYEPIPFVILGAAWDFDVLPE
ncbi:hypothetical protein UFOVP100_51 [uncultured Caudovirales phage]|uniref:Bacteriophage P22, Gp10, DNA-stabilising n=1 Tax=uncultured Caudovirales phage TaxID=2100421 RepID=A0A6J5L6G7_9CAUD|nr:hypothetical protein UFOVP100_51 [uncultured Caudovirales phage]